MVINSIKDIPSQIIESNFLCEACS